MKLLYIDLFCGAGGTSTGVENARHDGRQCAKVIGCVNHDANAIASHAANHPDALHFTEDIRTLERLIEIFTDKGDVVIDPCAGSGTTLLAAANMGRKAYGFEIKKDFCAEARVKVLPRISKSLFV